MRCCAIIPARGGSKGIPRKNVCSVGGQPLIVHTIRAACAAERIDRVVVSTDDMEIAGLARDHGATVVIRPAAIAGDAATSESALLHALDALRDEHGYEPDLLCFLQCTSPLTTNVDIDGAIQTLLENEADSAVAVAPFHYFLWRKGDGGEATAINHDQSFRLRRQDREKQYQETGSIYVMRVDGFRRSGNRFFGKTVLHVVPEERLLEIDEAVDLTVAEALMQARRSHSFRAICPPLQAMVMDFDGVLTDNLVYVDQNGGESVSCSRGDGLGLEMLRSCTDLRLLILSKERNPVVAARADKLRILCLQGVDDKVTALRRWSASEGVDLARVIYVGNDANDQECMRLVGIAVAPADAHPTALRQANWVLQNRGGRGAIRELADHLLEMDDARIAP